jgi:hypothetical protein
MISSSGDLPDRPATPIFGVLVFYHISEESVKKNQPMRD